MREPKPEPVPPPKEWKIRKPWREEQLSGEVISTLGDGHGTWILSQAMAAFGPIIQDRKMTKHRK